MDDVSIFEIAQNIIINVDTSPSSLLSCFVGPLWRSCSSAFFKGIEYICYDSYLFLFHFISILPYVILQMSEFHLAIYKLFISILRNMVVGQRVGFWAPLTGLNSQVVFLLLPVPRQCPLCSNNMLFVNFICLLYVCAVLVLCTCYCII